MIADNPCIVLDKVASVAIISNWTNDKDIPFIWESYGLPKPTIKNGEKIWMFVREQRSGKHKRLISAIYRHCNNYEIEIIVDSLGIHYIFGSEDAINRFILDFNSTIPHKPRFEADYTLQQTLL